MQMSILQHVPFEGPGAILMWAKARGVAVNIAHLYLGDPLPELVDFDMLTVLGGPMSVNDETDFPFITEELALIRNAINAGKIVFGVCLGSQMIAKALGAKVFTGPEKEIGWHPVNSVKNADADFWGLPDTFVPFHWHGDTFDLPNGASLLASSKAISNQAFCVGQSVLGLQFHIEATSDSVADLLTHARSDIGNGRFEQTPTEILAGIENCKLIHPVLNAVLDRLTGQPLQFTN